MTSWNGKKKFKMCVYLCNISSKFSYQSHGTASILEKKRLVGWKLLEPCCTSPPLPLSSGSPLFPLSWPGATSSVGSSSPGSSNISSGSSIVSSCFLLMGLYWRMTLETKLNVYWCERMTWSICHVRKCLSIRCSEIKS